MLESFNWSTLHTADHTPGNGYINQPGNCESHFLTRMRSAPKLVSLVLLIVNVSCLPGPDPGAYHISKTVWATKKGASSPAAKIGEILFGSVRSPVNADLRSFVHLFDESLSRALNLHLKAVWVSVRSVSG